MSPPRFAGEILFRSLAKGKQITLTYQGQTYQIVDVEHQFADELHYDVGVPVCFAALGAYAVLYVLVATGVIWIRNWKFL